jgi:hypothetical protein
VADAVRACKQTINFEGGSGMQIILKMFYHREKLGI